MGYNLYYGLKAAYGSRYKWLDVQALARTVLEPGAELSRVKHFTAINKASVGARERQDTYLKALRAHCDRLEVHKSRFLSTTKSCRTCGASYEKHEEKRTDVNIACEILNDLHLHRCDYFYLVSGDSDLVRPLELIRQGHPGRRAVAACPPRRRSRDLCKTAHGWFAISEQNIRRSQLPETVISDKGNPLRRPAAWD